MHISIKPFQTWLPKKTNIAPKVQINIVYELDFHNFPLGTKTIVVYVPDLTIHSAFVILTIG